MDTFGFAIKATAGYINGKEVHVSKNPKTDTGLKKSAKGYVSVVEEDGKLVLRDGLDIFESEFGLLKTVFHDNVPVELDDLSKIRSRVESYL